MGGRSIELLLALALTNPEIGMATALLNLFVGVDLLLGAGVMSPARGACDASASRPQPSAFAITLSTVKLNVSRQMGLEAESRERSIGRVSAKE